MWFWSKGRKLRESKISLGLQKGSQLYSQMAVLQKKILCVMRHVVVESRYLCTTNSRLHTPEEKTNQGHLRTACQLLFLLAILCSMCAVEARISTTTSSWGSQGISNYILAARICMVTTAKWSYFIQQRLYLSLEKAIALWSINAATQAI